VIVWIVLAGSVVVVSAAHASEHTMAIRTDGPSHQAYRSVTRLQCNSETGVNVTTHDKCMESLTFEVETLMFESCHSTWLFDTHNRRFCRALKGVTAGEHPITTQWRPYYGLVVDPVSEAFTVLLDPAGTRLLRSWRHTDDCSQCGGHVMSNLSIDEVRRGLGKAV